MLISSKFWIVISFLISSFVILLYVSVSNQVGDLQEAVLTSKQAKLEAKPSDPNDDVVIIYNRVPKTGSTSFIGLAYSLCSANKFNVIHINTTKNAAVLSLPDQIKFVYNVSYWMEKKPAIYHGHIAYINFQKFGNVAQPIYINIIRRPLDRLISYFYFLRYGDDLRPYLVRKRQGDKMTFDECVEVEHTDCSVQHMWLQVPFFCGQHADCWIPGSEWALEQAKHNVVNNYFLVGTTELMADFVAILEYSIPRIFKGSLDLYYEGGKSHLRKTVKKILPSEETVQKIKDTKVWILENEFYTFVESHFEFIRSKTLIEQGDSIPLPRGSAFSYEKIKPKPQGHR